MPLLIALDEQRGNAAAWHEIVRWRLWQSSGHFLPDDQPAHRRRDHCFNSGIARKERRQRLAKLLSESRILQHQRALHVHPAMQAAGKLKVAVPDGTGSFKSFQQFVVVQACSS